MNKGMEIIPTEATADPMAEEPADRAPTVCEMSWEEFEKANLKVGMVHDGLFRRLAEHDKTRQSRLDDEPKFLTRPMADGIHEQQIETYRNSGL